MATKTDNSSEGSQQGIKMSNERTCQCTVKSIILKTASITCKRSKLIFKKKLCYGCFQEIKKDHNAKDYSKRRFCKVCSGKHPTTSHGYVRKKVDNNQHRCNSEASEERKDGSSMCIIEYWYGLDKYLCSSSKVKTWRLWRYSENLCTFG